ncbi:MAG TPA: SpoIIE family protein phosphatase [Solirubrobacteraceae bacterium]|nr:SpoIIE family protein phosphatase [Solirubrobacteraceae bacterium]
MTDQLLRGAGAAILDALNHAITIRGHDQHLIYANKAALDRLGVASVEDLRNTDPRMLMGGFEPVDEDGRPISMEELPSVRLLRGEQPEPLLLRWVSPATGEEHWALLTTTAVRDSHGAIEAAVTMIEDVTDSRRKTIRLEFLAQTTDRVLGSLDYQETLRSVASLAVPLVADWCAVDLFDGHGGRESVAVAHTDPAKVQLAERLRAFEPDHLDPDQGLGLVLRTGEPLLYEEITDELLVRAARDAEHLKLLRAVGMRSALIVPMTGREHAIGALTMVNAESGRVFRASDLEFAEQIAKRAGIVVENARLYSERAEIARTLQRSLLPDAIPEFPGWEISTLYLPAGRGNLVGGDFYDFWEVEGDLLMIIGDVTGKGVGAAAMTSLVRQTARAASEFDPRPSRILERINAALKRRPSLSICTAACLRFREDRVTMALGGHPLPTCVSGEHVHEVGQPGTMLGVFDNASSVETSFTVHPGETLVAITDGVTDTRGPGGERFGEERLMMLLADTGDAPPGALSRQLATALEEFQVGAQADDTAAVFMRFTG